MLVCEQDRYACNANYEMRPIIAESIIYRVELVLWRKLNLRRRNHFPCVLPRPLPVALQPGDPFEAVCDGCQVDCDGCYFEDPEQVPTCTSELEHSTSPGGNVTLETLSIEPGYWRATASSEGVFECYNPDACLGGVTGVAGYCREGYEGPCE